MMRNASAVSTAVAQFLPFPAKTVTSIMRYTGLLVAVLVIVFTLLIRFPKYRTEVFLIIYH
jgi:hypothetical protein